MLKKILVVVLISGLYWPSMAQNRPQFTLYNLNTFLINPAVTGAEEHGDLRIGYRNQWQGISGAPKTYYASFHTPLGIKVLKSRSREQGYKLDPFAKAASNRPSTIAHHGIGGAVISDKIGAFTHTQISVAYAYHLSLTEEVALSAGVNVGYAQNSIDYDEVIFENDQDPILGQGVERDNGVDGSFGLMLYGSNFYAGVAALKKFSKGFEVNSNEFTSDQQLYVMINAGYKWTLSREFALMPNLLVRMPQDAPISFDVGVTAAYRDRIWLGASYRNDRSILGLMRIGVNDMIDLGYSYDFSTNEVSDLGTGSHELVLGIKLNSQNQVHSGSRFF